MLMRICFFKRKEKYDIKLIYHNNLMDTFLYILVFITGIFFGSFFTLAVYRIPKKEDILIKHSYCPNCNHRLGFFDLFPVLSYIFLGGKCRYCKNKIRPRYLILELLSGITFLLITISTKVDFLNVSNIVKLAFLLMYISVLFIIAGIDKENRTIERKVLFFGFIIEIIYIIYQYTLGIFNVYQYVMYSIMFVILAIISSVSTKFKLKENYALQVLYLCIYMIVWSGSCVFIFTAMFTLIIVAIYAMLSKNKKNIHMGFYLCISNILIITITNILINYML